MADFKKSYLTYVKPIEGFYVNDPADRGGETYGGIARNIFPSWEGWVIVDAFKEKNNGKIKRNTQIPEADPLVEKFFEELYNRMLFPHVTNQSIADILFDWCVNTIRSYARTGKSTPIKYTQKIVGVSDDGIMGKNTLGAINAFNQEDLFNRILKRREEFYEAIIKNDPIQEKFRAGWFKRLYKFKFKEV